MSHNSQQRGIGIHVNPTTTQGKTGIIRNGEPVDKKFFLPERPEDTKSFDYDGPDSLKTYHENGGLARLTVGRDTLETVEHHYPVINEHLPLRLLIQYLLFNRHAIELNSTWDGDGSPLPATMLAWMAGRSEQYDSRNFRAEDMLWWARDELFGNDFLWNSWRWHPDRRTNRYRRVTKLDLQDEVERAINAEMQRSVSHVDSRVWFATGTAYTAQAESDFRSQAKQVVSNLNANALDEKGNPDVPTSIQEYLNGLPVNGFRRVVEQHIQGAYETLDDLDPGRSRKHAQTVLRHIEDNPQPLYEVKRNTQRLYAPNSLQNLNREIRKILVQDWIPLDLKSAHLAICARLWDIGPMLDFLQDGGDIWEELLPHMEMGKPTVKKALYALAYGATVYWTDYEEHPSQLDRTFMKGAGLSWEAGKEARNHFLDHQLVRALFEARNRRIEEIEEVGFVKDAFGVELELDGGDGVTPLTLLTAEAAAAEMMLLWPSFKKVIDKEKRCKIMLYTFDGIYVKVHNPTRTDTWIRKLQGAVDERADELEIPTRLEHEK